MGVTEWMKNLQLTAVIRPLVNRKRRTQHSGKHRTTPRLLESVTERVYGLTNVSIVAIITLAIIGKSSFEGLTPER